MDNKMPGARGRSRWLPLLAATLVAACAGSDGDDAAAPALPSKTPLLAEGAYAVVASGDTLSQGEAFYGAAQQGFVLLSDEQSAGQLGGSVLYVTGPAGARRVPAAAGPGASLGFERSEALATTALAAADLAGSYQAWLKGQALAFTVAPDGALSATGQPCSLSGKLDAGIRYGAALAATLTLGSGCAQAAGEYKGLLYAARDLAPARWRLVAENGSVVLDLLAYR